MRARQRPHHPDDEQPGDWWWMDDPLDGIFACLPNGHTITVPTERRALRKTGQAHPSWTITGDGDTITATPSIWLGPGYGAREGEWHGWLTNGEWRSC